MIIRPNLSNALLFPVLLALTAACSSDGDDSGDNGGSSANGGESSGGTGGTSTGGTNVGGAGGSTGGTDNAGGTEVGGSDNAGGTGGSGSVCEPGCAASLDANCPNGPSTLDVCLQFCEANLDSTSPCKDLYEAVMACAQDGGYEYSCSESGAAVPTGCNAEVTAYVSCLDNN